MLQAIPAGRNLCGAHRSQRVLCTERASSVWAEMGFVATACPVSCVTHPLARRPLLSGTEGNAKLSTARAWSQTVEKRGNKKWTSRFSGSIKNIPSFRRTRQSTKVQNMHISCVHTVQVLVLILRSMLSVPWGNSPAMQERTKFCSQQKLICPHGLFVHHAEKQPSLLVILLIK